LKAVESAQELRNIVNIVPGEQPEVRLKCRSVSRHDFVSGLTQTYKVPDIELYASSKFRKGYYQLLGANKAKFGCKRLVPYDANFFKKSTYERLNFEQDK
jgi:hypothetical protein